ncbi:MAG: hypothetical protein ACYDEJ_15505 [Desulfitobacteriaceae bacterium]
MFESSLEPTDYCGCGDVGYLTTRSLSIDLVHGVGKINQVPVYHCRTDSCPEFMIPSNVSRRLDELAEKMENLNSSELKFYWKTTTDNTGDFDNNTIELTRLQAFILQLDNREYEDAKVIFVVPERAVFLQSLLDRTEYYILQYEPEYSPSGIWLSLSKFYYDKPNLTYEDYLNLAEEDLTKELGAFTFEETEESLEEEFGNII